MPKTGILCAFFLLSSLSVSTGQRCGRSDHSIRIMGGRVADRLQWPWMALVTVRTTGSVGYCSGTLISDRWVLTAAHCILNGMSSLEVTLGEHDLHRREGTEVRLRGSDVYLNNYNDDNNNGNDIALIELSRRLDLNGRESHLQPICLQSSARGVDSNRCVATGWGRISSKSAMSSVLREVKLPIVDNTICKLIWRDVFNPRQQLCAGYSGGGHDTCQGDSGGPLNCQLANGVWIQEGVTSYGTGCRKPFPSVFTRVSAYVPWIESVTGIRVLS